MGKTAIVTDSNSGITQAQGAEWGVYVLPMPFYIDGELHYEDIDITAEEFFARQTQGAQIKTSQPIVGELLALWDELLESHDDIVYIPMSSGLSGSCMTATGLAQDYDGRVQVVNNQRISLTTRTSVLDAKRLADAGTPAVKIREILEEDGLNASIYITVDTLSYLKKGGRITAAAAAIGSLLRIKPVLQIQGEKLDSYAKARSMTQARSIMIEAVRHDFTERFHVPEDGTGMNLDVAYTGDIGPAETYRDEVRRIFPGCRADMVINPLSLSVSCHIGPGALALATSKILEV